MIRSVFFLGLALFTSFAAAPTSAETKNWPQYRGAASDGLGEGETLPETWSETENVVWRTKLPGWGWSSPIVWGDRIFTTSAAGKTELPTPHVGGYPGGHVGTDEEHRWLVHSVDYETGTILWEFEAHRGPPPKARHPRNSYASETPVTDGERIYAWFANIGLFCLDFTCRKLWERRWPAYSMRDEWNTGTSPVLHGDRLFIQNDNEEESWIECLDKHTGKTLWHVARDERSTWSTPYYWQSGPRDELITIGTNRIRSYDPENGTLHWELSGSSGLVSLMPVAKNGLLYVGAGYHYGPLYAIHPGAKGDISLKNGATNNEFVAWSQRRGSSIHPCYLVSGERLFVCYDSGLFACYHAKTGAEILPKTRLDTKGGRFYASPWSYNGKVFLLNENGDTWVIEDAPAYKLIRKNSVGDVTWATPAIAHGSLFLRTYSWLFRIQERME